MNIIINFPCIQSMAWRGRSAFLLLFVDKLSIPVLPAAVGSKINVSSLPFLLSHEGRQPLWDTPNPKSLIRELVPSLIPCGGLLMPVLSHMTPLFRNGNVSDELVNLSRKKRQHSKEATKKKFNWASQTTEPTEWKAIRNQAAVLHEKVSAWSQLHCLSHCRLPSSSWLVSDPGTATPTPT